MTYDLGWIEAEAFYTQLQRLPLQKGGRGMFFSKKICPWCEQKTFKVILITHTKISLDSYLLSLFKDYSYTTIEKSGEDHREIILDICELCLIDIIRSIPKDILVAYLVQSPQK